MRGGAGNDAYFVDDVFDQMIENAGEGNDTVYATVHLGLSANVENLILQGGADLQGYGNALVNALYGNGGNNLLNGNGGADVMVGGLGNDAYFVDDGNDLVIENPGEGNDTVYATVHLGLSANVENLILQGNADLQGYGNALVNALYGNSGNNILNGNGGADVMVGGLGNDAYFVDDGFDQVIENAGEGNDTIYASVHFVLPANVDNLVQQGSFDLGGTGNALVNGIFGNSGNNTLDGQGAADVLTGNAVRVQRRARQRRHRRGLRRQRRGGRRFAAIRGLRRRRHLHQRGRHPLAGQLQRRHLPRRHHVHERSRNRCSRLPVRVTASCAGV
jgi:Ca2+-binding RTX toxin-like protein